MNTITIEKVEGYYTVRQGDRYTDGLCWDEMLGTVCELTHPSIGSARYRMATAEEWAQWHQRMKDRGGDVVDPPPVVRYRVLDRVGDAWFEAPSGKNVVYAASRAHLSQTFETREQAQAFIAKRASIFAPYTIVEVAP